MRRAVLITAMRLIWSTVPVILVVLLSGRPATALEFYTAILVTWICLGVVRT